MNPTPSSCHIPVPNDYCIVIKVKFDRMNIANRRGNRQEVRCSNSGVRCSVNEDRSTMRQLQALLVIGQVT